MRARWRQLPPAAKEVIWRSAATVDVATRLVYRLSTGERRPIPPLAVRGHVGASFWPTDFVQGGRAVLEDLERVLADAGRPLHAAGDVLDLACGPGRVSLHVAERYPDVRLTGCDVDPRSIRWAARKLDGRFVTTSSRPPLPFEEGSFDLVFSYSLWTHLSEPDQLAWLQEVRRVLRPTGLAVLTTQGAGSYRWFTRSPDAFVQSASFMESLRAAGDPERDGFVFAPYDPAAVSGPGLRGIEGEYGMSFQTPEYTRERWGEYVDVLDVLPDAIVNQDAVLVARRRQP